MIAANNQGRSTRAKDVYAALKADIISLRLRPGSLVQEEALAQSLGVSRTPLREALHRLGQEGLVETLPKKGTMVADISLNDAREIFQVRLANEPLAARLAASFIPADEVQRLWDLHTNPPAPFGDFREGDRQLHSSIALYCGNRRLKSIIESLMDETTRVLRTISTDNLSIGHQHHLKIIEALRARDGAKAEQVMREHIVAFQQFIVSSLFK